jgi:hypothetical protein
VGTASAYGYLADGTKYEACRTIQYNLRPALNTSVLIVSPQSSWWLGAKKTIEEMQEEAKQKGWLSIWHEFSWFYPWYRLHYVYSYLGTTQFDVGVALSPFADTIQYSQIFIDKITGLLSRVIWAIVTGMASSEFFSLIVASGGPGFFLSALASSVSIKALTAIANWNSIEGLMSTYIGVLVPTVVSLVRTSFWDLFLRLLEWMENIRNIAAIGWGKLYFMLSFAINIFYMGKLMQRMEELGAW